MSTLTKQIVVDKDILDSSMWAALNTWSEHEVGSREAVTARAQAAILHYSCQTLLNSHEINLVEAEHIGLENLQVLALTVAIDAAVSLDVSDLDDEMDIVASQAEAAVVKYLQTA